LIGLPDGDGDGVVVGVAGGVGVVVGEGLTDAVGVDVGDGVGVGEVEAAWKVAITAVHDTDEDRVDA
jgi:hypothetical protein